MSERSDDAYKLWRDATEKFDYFMLGVTGALSAYAAEHLEPTRVGLNAGTIELVALACFVGSAILGYQRLREAIMVLSAQAQRLRLEGDSDIARVEGSTDAAAIHVDRGVRFAVWRNRLLFTGFIVLVVARIAPAYGTDAVTPILKQSHPIQANPPSIGGRELACGSNPTGKPLTNRTACP